MTAYVSEIWEQKAIVEGHPLIESIEFYPAPVREGVSNKFTCVGEIRLNLRAQCEDHVDRKAEVEKIKDAIAKSEITPAWADDKSTVTFRQLDNFPQLLEALGFEGATQLVLGEDAPRSLEKMKRSLSLGVSGTRDAPISYSINIIGGLPANNDQLSSLKTISVSYKGASAKLSFPGLDERSRENRGYITSVLSRHGINSSTDTYSVIINDKNELPAALEALGVSPGYVKFIDDWVQNPSQLICHSPPPRANTGSSAGRG